MKLSNFIVIYVLLKFILYNTIKSIDSKEDPNDSLLSDEYKHDIHPTNQKKGKCHKKIGEILLIRKNPENLISHNKLIILNADQTGLLLVDSKKQSLIKKISFNQISNINNEITTKSEGFPIQNCFKITFTNKSNNSDIFMCARNKLEKSTWINSIKDLKNCQRTTSLNNNNEFKLFIMMKNIIKSTKSKGIKDILKQLKTVMNLDKSLIKRVKYYLKLKTYDDDAKIGRICYKRYKSLSLNQLISIICFKLSKKDEDIYNICRKESNFCNSCCTKIGNDKKCINKCQKELNSFHKSQQDIDLNINNHPDLKKEIDKEEDELNRLINKTYKLKNLGDNNHYEEELFKRISSFPKRIKTLKQQFRKYMNSNRQSTLKGNTINKSMKSNEGNFNNTERLYSKLKDNFNKDRVNSTNIVKSAKKDFPNEKNLLKQRILDLPHPSHVNEREHFYMGGNNLTNNPELVMDKQFILNKEQRNNLKTNLTNLIYSSKGKNRSLLDYSKEINFFLKDPKNPNNKKKVNSHELILFIVKSILASNKKKASLKDIPKLYKIVSRILKKSSNELNSIVEKDGLNTKRFMSFIRDVTKKLTLLYSEQKRDPIVNLKKPVIFLKKKLKHLKVKRRICSKNNPKCLEKGLSNDNTNCTKKICSKNNIKCYCSRRENFHLNVCRAFCNRPQNINKPPCNKSPCINIHDFMNRRCYCKHPGNKNQNICYCQDCKSKDDSICSCYHSPGKKPEDCFCQEPRNLINPLCLCRNTYNKFNPNCYCYQEENKIKPKCYCKLTQNANLPECRCLTDISKHNPECFCKKVKNKYKVECNCDKIENKDKDECFCQKKENFNNPRCKCYTNEFVNKDECHCQNFLNKYKPECNCSKDKYKCKPQCNCNKPEYMQRPECLCQNLKNREQNPICKCYKNKDDPDCYCKKPRNLDNPKCKCFRDEYRNTPECFCSREENRKKKECYCVRSKNINKVECNCHKPENRKNPECFCKNTVNSKNPLCLCYFKEVFCKKKENKFNPACFCHNRDNFFSPRCKCSSALERKTNPECYCKIGNNKDRRECFCSKEKNKSKPECNCKDPKNENECFCYKKKNLNHPKCKCQLKKYKCREDCFCDKLRNKYKPICFCKHKSNLSNPKCFCHRTENMFKQECICKKPENRFKKGCFCVFKWNRDKPECNCHKPEKRNLPECLCQKKMNHNLPACKCYRSDNKDKKECFCSRLENKYKPECFCLDPKNINDRKCFCHRRENRFKPECHCKLPQNKFKSECFCKKRRNSRMTECNCDKKKNMGRPECLCDDLKFLSKPMCKCYTNKFKDSKECFCLRIENKYKPICYCKKKQFCKKKECKCLLKENIFLPECLCQKKENKNDPRCYCFKKENTLKPECFCKRKENKYNNLCFCNDQRNKHKVECNCGKKKNMKKPECFCKDKKHLNHPSCLCYQEKNKDIPECYCKLLNNKYKPECYCKLKGNKHKKECVCKDPKNINDTRCYCYRNNNIYKKECFCQKYKNIYHPLCNKKTPNCQNAADGKFIKCLCQKEENKDKWWCKKKTCDPLIDKFCSLPKCKKNDMDCYCLFNPKSVWCKLRPLRLYCQMFPLAPKCRCLMTNGKCCKEHCKRFPLSIFCKSKETCLKTTCRMNPNLDICKCDPKRDIECRKKVCKQCPTEKTCKCKDKKCFCQLHKKNPRCFTKPDCPPKDQKCIDNHYFCILYPKSVFCKKCKGLDQSLWLLLPVNLRDYCEYPCLGKKCRKFCEKFPDSLMCNKVPKREDRHLCKDEKCKRNPNDPICICDPEKDNKCRTDLCNKCPKDISCLRHDLKCYEILCQENRFHPLCGCNFKKDHHCKKSLCKHCPGDKRCDQKCSCDCRKELCGKNPELCKCNGDQNCINNLCRLCPKDPMCDKNCPNIQCERSCQIFPNLPGCDCSPLFDRKCCKKNPDLPDCKCNPKKDKECCKKNHYLKACSCDPRSDPKCCEKNPFSELCNCSPNYKQFCQKNPDLPICLQNYQPPSRCAPFDLKCLRWENYCLLNPYDKRCKECNSNNIGSNPKCNSPPCPNKKDPRCNCYCGKFEDPKCFKEEKTCNCNCKQKLCKRNPFSKLCFCDPCKDEYCKKAICEKCPEDEVCKIKESDQENCLQSICKKNRFDPICCCDPTKDKNCHAEICKRCSKDKICKCPPADKCCMCKQNPKLLFCRRVPKNPCSLFDLNCIRKFYFINIFKKSWFSNYCSKNFNDPKCRKIPCPDYNNPLCTQYCLLFKKDPICTINNTPKCSCKETVCRNDPNNPICKCDPDKDPRCHIELCKKCPNDEICVCKKNCLYQYCLKNNHDPICICNKNDLNCKKAICGRFPKEETCKDCAENDLFCLCNRNPDHPLCKNKKCTNPLDKNCFRLKFCAFLPKHPFCTCMRHTNNHKKCPKICENPKDCDLYCKLNPCDYMCKNKDCAAQYRNKICRNNPNSFLCKCNPFSNKLCKISICLECKDSSICKCDKKDPFCMEKYCQENPDDRTTCICDPDDIKCVCKLNPNKNVCRRRKIECSSPFDKKCSFCRLHPNSSYCKCLARTQNFNQCSSPCDNPSHPLCKIFCSNFPKHPKCLILNNVSYKCRNSICERTNGKDPICMCNKNLEICKKLTCSRCPSDPLCKRNCTDSLDCKKMLCEKNPNQRICKCDPVFDKKCNLELCQKCRNDLSCLCNPKYDIKCRKRYCEKYPQNKICQCFLNKSLPHCQKKKAQKICNKGDTCCYHTYLFCKIFPLHETCVKIVKSNPLLFTKAQKKSLNQVPLCPTGSKNPICIKYCKRVKNDPFCKKKDECDCKKKLCKRDPNNILCKCDAKNDTFCRSKLCKRCPKLGLCSKTSNCRKSKPVSCKEIYCFKNPFDKICMCDIMKDEKCFIDYCIKCGKEDKICKCKPNDDTCKCKINPLNNQCLQKSPCSNPFDLKCNGEFYFCNLYPNNQYCKCKRNNESNCQRCKDKDDLDCKEYCHKFKKDPACDVECRCDCKEKICKKTPNDYLCKCNPLKDEFCKKNLCDNCPSNPICIQTKCDNEIEIKIVKKKEDCLTRICKANPNNPICSCNHKEDLNCRKLYCKHCEKDMLCKCNSNDMHCQCILYPEKCPVCQDAKCCDKYPERCPACEDEECCKQNPWKCRKCGDKDICKKFPWKCDKCETEKCCEKFPWRCQQTDCKKYPWMCDKPKEEPKKEYREILPGKFIKVCEENDEFCCSQYPNNEECRCRNKECCKKYPLRKGCKCKCGDIRCFYCKTFPHLCFCNDNDTHCKKCKLNPLLPECIPKPPDCGNDEKCMCKYCYFYKDVPMCKESCKRCNELMWKYKKENCGPIRDRHCEDIVICSKVNMEVRSIKENCTDTYIKEQKRNKTCEIEETPMRGLMNCKDEYALKTNITSNCSNVTIGSLRSLPLNCSDYYLPEPLDSDCEVENKRPKSLPFNCTDFHNKHDEDVVCNIDYKPPSDKMCPDIILNHTVKAYFPLPEPCKDSSNLPKSLSLDCKDKYKKENNETTCTDSTKTVKSTSANCNDKYIKMIDNLPVLHCDSLPENKPRSLLSNCQEKYYEHQKTKEMDCSKEVVKTLKKCMNSKDYYIREKYALLKPPKEKYEPIKIMPYQKEKDENCTKLSIPPPKKIPENCNDIINIPRPGLDCKKKEEPFRQISLQNSQCKDIIDNKINCLKIKSVLRKCHSCLEDYKKQKQSINGLNIPIIRTDEKCSLCIQMHKNNKKFNCDSIEIKVPLAISPNCEDLIQTKNSSRILQEKPISLKNENSTCTETSMKLFSSICENCEDIVLTTKLVKACQKISIKDKKKRNNLNCKDEYINEDTNLICCDEDSKKSLSTKNLTANCHDEYITTNISDKLCPSINVKVTRQCNTGCLDIIQKNVPLEIPKTDYSLLNKTNPTESSCGKLPVKKAVKRISEKCNEIIKGLVTKKSCNKTLTKRMGIKYLKNCKDEFINEDSNLICCDGESVNKLSPNRVLSSCYDEYNSKNLRNRKCSIINVKSPSNSVEIKCVDIIQKNVTREIPKVIPQKENIIDEPGCNKTFKVPKPRKKICEKCNDIVKKVTENKSTCNRTYETGNHSISNDCKDYYLNEETNTICCDGNPINKDVTKNIPLRCTDSFNKTNDEQCNIPLSLSTGADSCDTNCLDIIQTNVTVELPKQKIKVEKEILHTKDIIDESTCNKIDRIVTKGISEKCQDVMPCKNTTVNCKEESKNIMKVGDKKCKDTYIDEETNTVCDCDESSDKKHLNQLPSSCKDNYISKKGLNDNCSMKQNKCSSLISENKFILDSCKDIIQKNVTVGPILPAEQPIEKIRSNKTIEKLLSNLEDSVDCKVNSTNKILKATIKENCNDIVKGSSFCDKDKDLNCSAKEISKPKKRVSESCLDAIQSNVSVGKLIRIKYSFNNTINESKESKCLPKMKIGELVKTISEKCQDILTNTVKIRKRTKCKKNDFKKQYVNKKCKDHFIDEDSNSLQCCDDEGESSRSIDFSKKCKDKYIKEDPKSKVKCDEKLSKKLTSFHKININCKDIIQKNVSIDINLTKPQLPPLPSSILNNKSEISDCGLNQTLSNFTFTNGPGYTCEDIIDVTSLQKPVNCNLNITKHKSKYLNDSCLDEYNTIEDGKVINVDNFNVCKEIDNKIERMKQLKIREVCEDIVNNKENQSKLNKRDYELCDNLSLSVKNGPDGRCQDIIVQFTRKKKKNKYVNSKSVRNGNLLRSYMNKSNIDNYINEDMKIEKRYINRFKSWKRKTDSSIVLENDNEL